MIYHEQEDGNYFAFKKTFQTREHSPALRGGDADYLAVTAPPEIFACLRTTETHTTVVLINFGNEYLSGHDDGESEIEIPREKLPERFRSKDVLYYSTGHHPDSDGRGDLEGVFKLVLKKGDAEDRFVKEETMFDGVSYGKSYGWQLWEIFETEEEARKHSLEVFHENPRPHLEQPTEETVAKWEKSEPPEGMLTLKDGACKAYIDAETGLLTRLDRFDVPVLGQAELMLPAEWAGKAGVSRIEQNEQKTSETTTEGTTYHRTERQVVVNKPFGETTLQFKYTAVETEAIRPSHAPEPRPYPHGNSAFHSHGGLRIDDVALE